MPDYYILKKDSTTFFKETNDWRSIDDPKSILTSNDPLDAFPFSSIQKAKTYIENNKFLVDFKIHSISILIEPV